MAQSDTGSETPTSTDVHVSEVVVHRTAIKRYTHFGRQRQTLARSQHPPMEMDGYQDEGVPCTLVTADNENHKRDNPTACHD